MIYWKVRYACFYYFETISLRMSENIFFTTIYYCTLNISSFSVKLWEYLAELNNLYRKKSESRYAGTYWNQWQTGEN